MDTQVKLFCKALTSCSNNISKRSLIICINNILVCICSSVSAALLSVREFHNRYYTISNSNVKSPAIFAFCKIIDTVCNSSTSCLTRSSRSCCSSFWKLIACICLANLCLSRHNNRTSLRNNLLIVGLINVASQCRNQQRGQDSQNNQNNDQFDEGEALFVFQFFEHLVFLQFFLFYTNISAPCRHFILSFYNTFRALSSRIVLLQLVLCFSAILKPKFYGKRQIYGI